MCRSWVCSEGIYKGTLGHKGVDKLNAAYRQSDRAAGVNVGMDGFTNVMNFFNDICSGRGRA